MAAERWHYLNAIQDALVGSEEARVTLAKAVERLEQEERAWREQWRRPGTPTEPA
jgi:hypothetical protein